MGDRPLTHQLVERFNDDNVAWCHWKSNRDLAESMDGSTDLDLLVDSARLADVYEAFASLGFRRGQVAGSRVDVGLEDFLGECQATGNLVHIHTHWRLVSGEAHHKRFRIPFERLILETRQRGEIEGTWTSHPAAEVVLLAIRTGLKLRWRDRLSLRIGHKTGIDDIGDELDWLVRRSSMDDIREFAGKMLGAKAATAAVDLASFGPSTRRLLRLRRAVQADFALQTSLRGPAARIERWQRELIWLRRGIARHYFPRPVLLGRGGPAGGLLVAIIGSDGSGKSTVVKGLHKWFSLKIDTLPIYFGSGDGNKSFILKPFKMVLGMRRKDGLEGAANTDEDPGRLSKPPTMTRAVWALAVSLEKRKTLRRAMKARTRGMLVIADRYPQTQIPGINDGPQLRAWAESSSGLRRRLSAFESVPYQRAHRFPPDLILRMTVSAEVAATRRPEHDPDDLKRRIRIVGSLEFPESLHGVVEIDADQTQSEVFAAARRAIFEHM